MQPLQPPIYDAPTGPPDWNGENGLEELKKHLQTAVLLELHTIPLYLFAAYSIKEKPSATKIIRIVKQEMLHLGLAGNVLRAIGGTPLLYGEAYTPQYPVNIFFEKKVKMELKPGTKANIATFVELEAPLKPPGSASLVPDDLLPQYQSIGEFYQATLTGLHILHGKHGDALFHKDLSGQQFQTSDGSWHGGDMTAIPDLASAVKALKLVIEQGEGAIEGVGGGAAGQQSHYEIFKELHDDDVKHPLNCWPVVENPKTSDFETKAPKIHKLMVFSDAVYSYLLLTLEKMWAYDGNKREDLVTYNVRGLMTDIMRPVAHFLVSIPLDNDPSINGAAPYNRYDFVQRGGETALAELKRLMNEAFAQFPGSDEPLDGVREAVEALIDLNTV